MKVLITGATGGLGGSIARFLKGQGHEVWAMSRSSEKLIEMEKEGFHILDMRDAGAWKVECMDRYITDLPNPDVLINCIGIAETRCASWEKSCDLSMLVNFFHPVEVCRWSVRMALRKCRPLIIVNVTSNWGRFPAKAGYAPYCASKHALEGYTLTLAKELPGIVHAYTLDPGTLNTAMLQGYSPEHASEYPTSEEWIEQFGPELDALMENPAQYEKRQLTWVL